MTCSRSDIESENWSLPSLDEKKFVSCVFVRTTIVDLIYMLSLSFSQGNLWLLTCWKSMRPLAVKLNSKNKREAILQIKP